MIAFETVPTTLSELTEWTDHTALETSDNAEHLAYGLIEEWTERRLVELEIERRLTVDALANVGGLKRRYRGDAKFADFQIQPFRAASHDTFSDLVDRYIDESGDMMWYMARMVRCMALRPDFDLEAYTMLVDGSGIDPEWLHVFTDTDDLEPIVKVACALIDRPLPTRADAFKRLHTKLTRRKLANTIKGEGDR